MSLDNAYENELLDYLFDTLEPDQWLGLYPLATPPTDGGGTEVSGGGYARVAIPGWTAASNGARATTGAIQFPTATAPWGTIRHYGVFDAASGGNRIGWGTFANQIDVGVGDAPRVNAAGVVVVLD